MRLGKGEKVMFDFILSIASDILASVVVAVVAWGTRKVWLDGFYSDVARVYKSQSRANKDINRDMESSPTINILAIRGRSFTDRERGEYPCLWSDTSKEIEIIVSSENNNEAIKARSSASDSSPEEYRMDILYTNQVLLKRTEKFPNMSVYNHHENLSFKLIILEQCVYVCYFLPEQSVHKSNTIKYKKDTGAYEAFLHYYNVLKNSESTIRMQKSE